MQLTGSADDLPLETEEFHDLMAACLPDGADRIAVAVSGGQWRVEDQADAAFGQGIAFQVWLQPSTLLLTGSLRLSDSSFLSG